MEKGTLKSIPGVFYDLIVYYGSSFIFISCLWVVFFDLHAIAGFLSSLKASGLSFLLILILSFCYVYGQLASTLSAIFVKRPISFLVTKCKPKSIKDYFFDYFADCEDFSVLEQTEKRLRKNYWTVLYFIKLTFPSIADDLLKRYARCKLARVNSFNFLFLAVITLAVHVSKKWGWFSSVSTSYFSGLVWSTFFLFASIVFAFEFYQRQCWFGDIVVKIFAAVVKRLSMTDSVPQKGT